MMDPVIVPYNFGDDPPKAALYYGMDCRDALRQLPDNSVHAIITSPPYWGLRDYGIPASIWGGDPDCDHVWEDTSVTRKGSTNGRDDLGSTLVSVGGAKTVAPGESNDLGETGQYRTDPSATCFLCGAWRGCLGSEPTPQMFVDHLVEVLREARRVLHPSGTLWVNLGDSYANDAKWGGSTGGKHAAGLHGQTSIGRVRKETQLKPKSLVGVPWRVAFALQEDGWILRSDIVWSKPNPLPESVEDRPTKAHEYIFLMTKSPIYFYDCEATKEPFITNPKPGMTLDLEAVVARARSESSEPSIVEVTHGRYRRSVWEVASKAYSGAHFAVWPEKLVEIMISAGTSARGACPSCKNPFARQITKLGKTTGRYEEFDLNAKASDRGILNSSRVSLGGEMPVSIHVTTGWNPTCTCGAGYDRAVVMDLFSGSGTTGMVALSKGRDYIGIDAGIQYLDLARSRIGAYRTIAVDLVKPEDGSTLDLFGGLEDESGGAPLTDEPECGE